MCISTQSVKGWGAGMVICLEQVADLHMSQLMLLPLTVSCFSKIQIGFTILVPADPGSPGKRAVKWMCVCVVLALGVCKMSGHKKERKNKHHVISPMCPMLNFGMWGDLTDVITHAKFFVDWFTGFRVLTPPFFSFLHRLSW